MKLDEIKDIDYLKNELKRFMIQCKTDYSKKNSNFKKNEYYYIHQDDDDGAYVYDYEENSEFCFLSIQELDKYFY